MAEKLARRLPGRPGNSMMAEARAAEAERFSMGEQTGDIWPTELRLMDQGKTLRVAFEGGEVFSLSAEFLRVVSPSAEVQGHGPDERITVGGKSKVTVRNVEPVGNYAVRLVFDDGHATGLYTWEYLRQIGVERDRLWSRYLDEIKEKGLAR
jgi:DUF971 family protein